ncbi:hypothetical protein M0R01_01025 [bacterium]|nr:hypothetical protein [bacterium]
MDIAIEALRQVERNFIYNGILAILFGVLIFIYPDLLAILVGIFFVILGVFSLVFAVKIGKYSKIKL